MTKAKFRRNIAWREGTVGNVLNANRDGIMKSKSPAEAYTKVRKAFEDSNVTSPKSREVLFKMQSFTKLADSLMYVQNLIFASNGLATY